MKLIIVAIAAVAVLGMGATMLPGMLGGGNDEKFKVSPQLEKTHLANLDSETVDYLPASLLEKVKSCDEQEKEFRSYEYKFAQGLKNRHCYLVSNLEDKPKDNGFYSSGINVLKDDNAKNLQKKFEEQPDTAKVRVQKAKGDLPEVYSVVIDKDTYVQAYYPKKKAMVTVTSYGSMTPGELEEWARYFGFMPKK